MAKKNTPKTNLKVSAKQQAEWKAQEQARAAEWREFAKTDYPKILKAAGGLDTFKSGDLRHYETIAFYNFLIVKKDIDTGIILGELVDLLDMKYPKALEAWHREIKDWAIEKGYCKWAKKHPKAAADLF